MKALAGRKSIDEILGCFDKIKTIELALESLPYESIADWRERLKVKEKRKRMEEEIIQLRAVLRNKMGPCTNRSLP